VSKKILVTGGAGFIGSHTVVELAAAGYEILLIDNFSNSEHWILDRIAKICGSRVPFKHLDLRDANAISACVSSYRPDSVIHFAALKSVGESVEQPLAYYENNLTGTLNLLQAMSNAGCNQLVFSSSATVYGIPERCPITEDAPLDATNPYGRTKLMMENVIRDLVVAQPNFQAAILRYFNPAGAHPSGEIGELPLGVPNNLIPYVAQVAAGLHPQVRVFGNDYPTPDGTGVRDYIHVCDVAKAHVAALVALDDSSVRELTVNLGTGRGYSVLEIVHAFQAAAGLPIPYTFAERRPGDVAECYADPTLSHRLLSWRAEHGLERICADAWRWQRGLR
jgi:UDP-glucose 4-epimerase